MRQSVNPQSYGIKDQYVYDRVGGNLNNLVLRLVVYRGTVDTGIVIDGDTSFRNTSADFRVTNADVKAKWTFV